MESMTSQITTVQGIKARSRELTIITASSSFEARDRVITLASSGLERDVQHAAVHRFQGFAFATGGYDHVWYVPHHLICGFNGNGPLCTAAALAALGFGNESQIGSEITVGGNTARFHYTK